MQQGDTLTTMISAEDASLIPQGGEEERFLQFQWVDGEMGLVSLNQIAGVVSVSVDLILAVPQMRAEVMGIYEWRGHPIWVVDLGAWVGLSPLTADHPQAVTVLILRSPGLDPIGGAVVVAQVGEIELLSPDQIQPPTPGIFTPQLQSLLRGYLPHSGWPILEVEWILQALVGSVSPSTS